MNASCAFASTQLHERMAIALRSHGGRIAAVASRLLRRIAVVQRRSQSAGGLTTSLESVRTASAAGSGQSDDDNTCRRRGRIVVVRCTGEVSRRTAVHHPTRSIELKLCIAQCM